MLNPRWGPVSLGTYSEEPGYLQRCPELRNPGALGTYSEEPGYLQLRNPGAWVPTARSLGTYGFGA